MKTSTGDKTVMNVYLCRYCGFYHIGHETRRRKRKTILIAEQGQKENEK